MRFMPKIFAGALALAALAAPVLADERAGAGSVALQDPIPGSRTCFWSRCPFGVDPTINVAYPDSGTLYWAATFTIPSDAKLTLEGRFPHARYISLISYDGAGVPIDDVAGFEAAVPCLTERR
jgi:hypothetical protein